MRTISFALALLVAFSVSTTYAAGGPHAARASNPGEAHALKGGVLATFAVGNEVFRLWTTNPQTIDQLYALWNGTSTANIPIGPVERGPGKAGYNRPWTWHLDPQLTTMTEVAAGVCDAEPSYLQANLQTWIRTVGYYCPWGARLIGLQDFR